MRLSKAFVVYLVALAAFLAAVIAICLLADANRALRSQVSDLRDELAGANDPHEGGAETAPPPIAAPPPGTDYEFPIAASDYRELTSPYGYRVSPILDVERYHEGVDIAATWRAQVVAAADGVVVDHWPPPGTPVPGHPGLTYKGHEVYGGYVVIRHATGWTTSYAHMSWTRVHIGDRVRAGEVIGRVGNTGESVGAHLHFEIRNTVGDALNPLLYVAARGEYR